MGDYYRPERRASYDRRLSPDRRYHDRSSTAQQNEVSNHYRGRDLARRPRDSRDAQSGDQGLDSGYSFRGAAGPHDNRAPEHKFSFRLPGPAGPSFPPETRTKTVSSFEPASSRAPSTGSKKSKSDRHSGPAKRYGPRPAHERDLLRRGQRSGTPEQMAGMRQQQRFKLADGSDYIDDEAARAKRIKLDAAIAARPKWSNPDPYTALPPVVASTGPKLDIVQVIRRAKLAAESKAAQNTAIERNNDFISFNEHEQGRNKLNARNGDEDEDNYYYKHDDASATRGRLRDSRAAPARASTHAPARRSASVPSADDRKDKRGTKRKRKEHDPYEVREEWQPIAGQDATPWFGGASSYNASDTGLR